MTNRRIVIGSIVVGIIMCLIVIKGCIDDINESKGSNVLYEHANDSTKYYKNKYGDVVASSYLLQGTNTTLLLHLKTTNETIKWLQQEVKDNKDKVKDGGVVGVIGTSTTFSATTTTTVLPVINEETSPTYITQQTDSTWMVYKIVSNKDSTTLNLKVKNKYTVVFGEERVKGKLFKKQPTALVTNKNPHTQVTEMKAFEVKMKDKRFSLGIQVGYGIPLFTFKPQPYIGIGINYSIIKL